MQSTKNALFRMPKVGKMMLMASGLLVVGAGLLLGNYAAKALGGVTPSSDEGKITFSNIKVSYLEKNFSKTHFTLNGNDFGGGVIWLPAKELSPKQAVQVGRKTYECSTQVRGFYYNSQRGERLWPLDEQTKGEMGGSYGNLTLNGGRYTNCSSPADDTSTDPYGIYGSIKHIDGLGNTYVLNAGIAYDINGNKMKNPGSFQCNLQRLNNQFPFGYFFDNAGGIGLLGASVKSTVDAKTFHSNLLGQITSTHCMADIYTFDGNTPRRGNESSLDFGAGTAVETIFRLGIRGVVGLSNQVQQEGALGKDGNENANSVLVRTDNSISAIFNLAKRNAEQLCKGKWGRDTTKKIICSENGISSDIGSLQGKTVIVKNGNLTLTDYLTNTTKANEPTTIFLMSGDLILPESTNNKVNFQGNGYLEGNFPAAYLKGNFIINGLLQIANNATLQNRLIVHGKIASLNTLEEPTNAQKEFLKKHIDAGKTIVLTNLFGRRCDAASGTGNDDASCSGNGFIVDKAFSLIDMNFPSPLFQ